MERSMSGDSTIPIINLGQLQDPESGSKDLKNDRNWVSVASEIRRGLCEIGFLYLANHGIPQEAIDNAFHRSKSFFALPESTKLKYEKDSSNLMDIKTYFGYNRPGTEKLHPEATWEFRESFDRVPPRGKYADPDPEVPGFGSSVETLDEHCRALTKKLLRLLAIGLRLEDTDFFLRTCQHLDNHEDHVGLANIRLLYYPPIPIDQEVPRGAVRCGEHSDYADLTLLFQDDIGGLEVKNASGNWTPAVPIPGSIVVNTGNLLEFRTKGLFPATPHRVLVPESEELRCLPRYSIAYFNGPDSESTIRTLDIERSQAEAEKLAKSGLKYSEGSVNALEFVSSPFLTTYKGYK